MKSKIPVFLLLILIGLSLSNPSSAALVRCRDCTISNLWTTIMNLINFLLTWSGLVAIIFVIWGGWQMLTSGGNEETVTAGKTTFSNAIIGFFLIMTAFVLLNFIVSLAFGDGKFRAGALIDAINLFNP